MRQISPNLYISLGFIFPTIYHVLIFDFSMMSYKSLKLFTFFLGSLVSSIVIFLLTDSNDEINLKEVAEKV